MSVDESETEVSGALGQAAHGTGAILSVVGGGPGVLIDEPILESAVDENGELSSGGGDGFGFTDAIGETSIVGAESGLCTPEAECGHAENASGAVCRGLCFRAEESPAGDFVIGREGKLPWCTTPIEADSSLGPDSHHPIISLSGIPSAVMVLRILHPILASTLCAANPLARIAERRCCTALAESKMRCLRCLLLVMCTHPFAREAFTLHLARSEGHERYFDCNLMHRRVLASSYQHLMAEAPEIPPPACEPGQVLVQTRYAGVQYPDALQAQGLYQQRPRLPYVPGMDVSGMVLELGDGVDGLAVGDEVFAQMSVGGLAEVAAAPASSVWPAPTGVPLPACANLGRNFFPSLLLLEDSR